MQLGEEVLNKIQQLLIEVDRPKSPKKKTNKSNTNVRKQIPINQNQNRLYNYYKQKRNRQNQREKQKVYEQLQKMQPFKVQNKKSIFLISQKQQKPIYQRTAQILMKKQLSVEMKRIQIQKEKERKKLLMMNEEQQQQQQLIRQRLNRKVSKRELNQILKRFTNRQNQRLNRQNAQKLNNLKNKLRQNKKKPFINQSSNKIWQKRQMQRSLSANVFQRFEKYQFEKKKKKQELISKLKQQITPFRPKISKNSRLIMEKSTSRVSLTNIDRSLSQKCLKKNTGSAYLNTSRNTFAVTPKTNKNNRRLF